MSTRVPVAIFLTSFDPGGTERQMTELIRRLSATRFDVHVICFHRRGAWLSRVEGSGTTIAEFPIQGFFNATAVRQLRALTAWLRDRGIQVLQTCDYYANVFGLLAGALARVPVRIASRRDVNPGRTRAQLALQQAAYRLAHYVVANSGAARSALLAEGVRPERIAVIPNGIDAAAFANPRASRPVRTVITVANLRPEKDHATLFAAAAILADAHPNLRFHIVGDGPLRAALERDAENRGLQHRILFLGHREDVPALLAQADLYVLPSRTEAFPNGVLEAMAAGLPVIACGVEGLLDLVDDGATGMLVPPGDSASLAAAIQRVAADPAFAARLGAAARTAAAARYSFESMVARFEALYLAGPRGGTVVPSDSHLFHELPTE